MIAPVNCIDAGGSKAELGTGGGSEGGDGAVGARGHIDGDDKCMNVGVSSACCVGASACHGGHVEGKSVVVKGGGGVEGGGEVGVYMEDDKNECGPELLRAIQQGLRILCEAVLSAGGLPRA